MTAGTWGVSRRGRAEDGPALLPTQLAASPDLVCATSGTAAAKAVEALRTLAAAGPSRPPQSYPPLLAALLAHASADAAPLERASRAVDSIFELQPSLRSVAAAVGAGDLSVRRSRCTYDLGEVDL